MALLITARSQIPMEHIRAEYLTWLIFLGLCHYLYTDRYPLREIRRKGCHPIRDGNLCLANSLESCTSTVCLLDIMCDAISHRFLFGNKTIAILGRYNYHYMVLGWNISSSTQNHVKMGAARGEGKIHSSLGWWCHWNGCHLAVGRCTHRTGWLGFWFLRSSYFSCGTFVSMVVCDIR